MRTGGAVISGRSESVEAFRIRWLAVTKKNVRPRSHDRYQEVVKHQLVPWLGSTKLDRLGVEAVQGMLTGLVDQGLSPEKPRAVLRSALNVAKKWRLLTWNPAELADLPKWKKRRMRILQLDEADRFLRAASGDRFEAIYTLALSTGMRQGELLGLRWSDVDFASREIRVQGQLQLIRHEDGRRRLTLVDVKSLASRRVIPMPALAAEALSAHRERQKVTSLQGLVFTTGHGTPISPRNLLRAYKALLGRAGLQPNEVRFHDLRHSCASFLIARGVDPKTVQAILGHATVRLTLETYAHAMPESLRAAALEIDRVLTARAGATV